MTNPYIRVAVKYPHVRTQALERRNERAGTRGKDKGRLQGLPNTSVEGAGPPEAN